MTYPVVSCYYCRWYWGVSRGKDRCKAFHEGIPDEIRSGRHKHRRKFEGDRGVRFEAKEVPETP